MFVCGRERAREIVERREGGEGGVCEKETVCVCAREVRVMYFASPDTTCMCGREGERERESVCV